ncbi:MAG: LapA family protein [Betaproteobacteria bacterium]
MHIVRWIVGATVFIALLFLSLQNSEPAELKFFNFASLRAPLVVVLFVAFAAGIAMGLLAGVLRAARLKRQVNKLRREQRKLQDPTGVTSGSSTPGTSPATGTSYVRGDGPPYRR